VGIVSNRTNFTKILC